MTIKFPINETINIDKYGSKSNDKRNITILREYITNADIYKLEGTAKRTKKQAVIDETLFVLADLPLGIFEGKSFIEDIKLQKKFYLAVDDERAYIAMFTKEQIVIQEFVDPYDMGSTFEFGGYRFVNTGKKF